jgi:hypothetical protein
MLGFYKTKAEAKKAEIKLIEQYRRDGAPLFNRLTPREYKRTKAREAKARTA